MRERVEDLGILASNLEKILRQDLWYDVEWNEDKDFVKKYEEFQNLDSLFFELNSLKQNLESLYKIARFG